jgi:hypothetical protein
MKLKISKEIVKIARGVSEYIDEELWLEDSIFLELQNDIRRRGQYVNNGDARDQFQSWRAAFVRKHPQNGG